MSKERLNRLKIILAEKDRSTKWLADKMNINRSTVSQWVNNNAQPSVRKLYEIGEILEIDTRELLYPKRVDD